MVYQLKRLDGAYIGPPTTAQAAIAMAHSLVCQAGLFSKLFVWMRYPEGDEWIHVGPCGPGRLTYGQIDDNDYLVVGRPSPDPDPRWHP